MGLQSRPRRRRQDFDPMESSACTPEEDASQLHPLPSESAV